MFMASVRRIICVGACQIELSIIVLLTFDRMFMASVRRIICVEACQIELSIIIL